MSPRRGGDKPRNRPGVLARIGRGPGITRGVRLDRAHLPSAEYKPEWDIKRGESPRMHHKKASKFTERLLRKNPRLQELRGIWDEYQKTGDEKIGMVRLEDFLEKVRGDGIRVEVVPEGHVQDGLVHVDPERGGLGGNAEDYAKARNTGAVLGHGIYIEEPMREQGFERFFKAFSHEYGVHILRNVFRGKSNIPHYGRTVFHMTHHLDERVMPRKMEE